MSNSSSYKEKDRGDEEIPDDDDDDETLKTRISSHPLYELLLETHLDCLKIGGIGDDLEEEDDDDILGDYMKQLSIQQKPTTLAESELDHFMEAYCLALRKLKEAMEEPHKNTMNFIANMHLQLKELTSSTTRSSHLDLPEPPAATGFHHHHTTSGES